MGVLKVFGARSGGVGGVGGSRVMRGRCRKVKSEVVRGQRGGGRDGH